MAIAVSDFLYGVRYRINDTDTNNPEYSDGELLKYLRSALRLLSLALTTEEWRGILKRESMTLSNGYVSLSSNFIKEYYVLDKDGNELKYSDAGPRVQSGYYSIIGKNLYAQQDASPLIVTYFEAYPIVGLDDDLPCPNWMEPYLTNIVAFLALNRNEFSLNTESALIKEAVSNIVLNTDTYGNRESLDFSIPF